MRHWGFCLILITVVKKSRDYGPRESPCYITFHTFLTFLTFHTFHKFLTFHTFHTFLNYLTLGFPVKPVFFRVVVSAHFLFSHLTLGFPVKPVFFRFFPGGGFCTFFLGGGFCTLWVNPPIPYTTLRNGRFISSVTPSVTAIVVKCAHVLSILCGLALSSIDGDFCVTVTEMNCAKADLGTGLIAFVIPNPHCVLPGPSSP